MGAYATIGMAPWEEELYNSLAERNPEILLVEHLTIRLILVGSSHSFIHGLNFGNLTSLQES